MAENTRPGIVPGSEQLDPDGNVQAFHIIDPINGERSVVPNFPIPGGNGTTLYDQMGGGGGAPTLDADPGYSQSFSHSESAPPGVGAPPPTDTTPAPPIVPSPPPSPVAPPLQPVMTSPVSSSGAPVTVNTMPQVSIAAGPRILPNGMMVDAAGNAIDTNTRHTQATSKQMNAEQAKAFESNKQGLAQAIETKLHADTALNVLQGEMATRQANDLRTHNEQVNADRIQFEKDQAARMEKLDTLTDQAANAKIDTNHYWADKTTGDKVLAGISILLGGLGAGLTGGPNIALQMIDKAITRDIDAQKANLEQQRAGAGLQKGLVGEFNREYKDKEIAGDAAYIAYWKQVQSAFEAKATGSKNELLKAQALEASALAKQKIDTTAAQLNEKSYTSGTSTQPVMVPLKEVPGEIQTHIDTLTSSANKLNSALNTISKSEGEGLGAGFLSGVQEGATRVGIGDRAATEKNRAAIGSATQAIIATEKRRNNAFNEKDVQDQYKIGPGYSQEDNIAGIKRYQEQVNTELGQYQKRAATPGYRGVDNPSPVGGSNESATPFSFKQNTPHRKK